MMDSSSRRLPFCLSSSRSSYTSSPSVSSSSLGSSRLSSRETTFSTDRYQRGPSSYKTDIDQQNSRYLSSSRDYGGSDSRSTNWRLPTSLSSSGRLYDYSRNDSSLSSRSKLSDSDGRLGMRSGLLNSSDDGDSKRAKLSYNRGLYSRTSSNSLTGSSYSTNGLSSVRGVAENPKEVFDSSRVTGHSRPSSSSSKSFSSWREQETKYEPRLLGLGERRTPGVGSSLYHTDRVTSTYAQGARPKETSYTSSSLSTARERSFNHQFSSSSASSASHFSPLVQDPSSRTATRLLNSSNLRSSQNSTGIPESSSHLPSTYSQRSSWYTRPESTLPPRPAGENEESQGRSSTRRLLSRLFSRRSSQDSSSGSSSIRSLDEDSPSTGGESVDGDEGTRTTSVELDRAGLEATLSSLRNARADLTPIQENQSVNSAASRTSSWRDPSLGNNSSSRAGGGNNSSWLTSSLRGRCPPLLSRLRRHTRHENAQSAAASEEEGGARRPQRLLRRWEDAEQKTSDEEDGDEEDEEEGAVGPEAIGAGHSWELDDESLPELEEGTLSSLSRSRQAPYQNPYVGPLRGAEISLDSQKEKPVSVRDQEKLRKIKESLLQEDSDEDEGDLCRICQMGEDACSNPLIQPCRCTGSLQYVHQECIKRWLCSKIGSGTNLEAITTCELCKAKLRLNIDNFDIQELYRTHAQSEYDEFISSGLYLVVLLHFCEQRFSDVLGAVDAAGLFNLVRFLHEHMDIFRSSNEESDGEVQDRRPSIDFSDLDDDLEDVFE